MDFNPQIACVELIFAQDFDPTFDCKLD